MAAQIAARDVHQVEDLEVSTSDGHKAMFGTVNPAKTSGATRCEWGVRGVKAKRMMEGQRLEPRLRWRRNRKTAPQ